jgi:hypothetical protein
VGERRERKQSEAELHRHCDTPHFVNEEHIVARENAKNAQTRRNFEVNQQSPHVDLAIDGEFAMKQMKLHVVKGALQHLCGKELECAVTLK